MKKPVRKNIKRTRTFSNLTYGPVLKDFVELIRSDIEVTSMSVQETDYEYEDSITINFLEKESKEDFQKRLDVYDRKVQKEKYINILNDNFVKYDSFIRDLKTNKKLLKQVLEKCDLLDSEGNLKKEL